MAKRLIINGHEMTVIPGAALKAVTTIAQNMLQRAHADLAQANKLLDMSDDQLAEAKLAELSKSAYEADCKIAESQLKLRYFEKGVYFLHDWKRARCEAELVKETATLKKAEDQIDNLVLKRLDVPGFAEEIRTEARANRDKARRDILRWERLLAARRDALHEHLNRLSLKL